MEFAVKKQRICRICMQDDILLDWNGELFEYCGMSFKDCYYKYSHLAVIDPDPFPQYVCEACSLDLQNFHLFMEKAIETQKFLEQGFDCIIKEDIQSEEESKPETECIYIVENCGDEWVEPVTMLTEEVDDKKSIELKTRRSVRRTSPKKRPMDSDEEDMESDEDIDFYEDVESDEYIEMPARSSNRRAKQAKNVPEKKKGRQAPVASKFSGGRRKHTAKKSSRQGLNKYAEKRKPGRKRSNDATINKNGPAMCSYCSKVVHNSYYLKRHEETHKEKRERNVACPKCNAKMYTKSALAEHMHTHEENRVKKYKCEFCDKAFYNRGACNVHRRIHLGQMLKCSLCPKEYFRQVDLDRHMLSHSSCSSNQTVTMARFLVHCDECDKDVRTKNFKEHQAMHRNDPQLKCKLCDKDFFSRSSCTKHMGKVHKRIAGKYDDIVEYYEGYRPRYAYLLAGMKKEKIPKS